MRILKNNKLRCALLSIIFILAVNQVCFSYSVLTHQAIIDTVWRDNFIPVLQKRFPGITEEQLREAHAYAYGGCIIQDMGYYPFSKRLFTDLLHYVRSGDFIETMVAESQDANEYAFALGALAHYAADNNGHHLGTNRAVPIYYPKLKEKFGDTVTYDQAPTAHLKAEFGFDVVQVALNNYTPEAYHDFIGFKVSRPVLERAFLKTYGLELKDIFVDVDLAISTYRNTAGKTIPYLTKVAWETKRSEIEKLAPGMTNRKYIVKYSRKEFEKEYGQKYSKPSFSQKVVAFFIRILPKFGALKGLDFKPATPETERLFLQSLNHSIREYRVLLDKAATGKLELVNRDFDTGQPTSAGEYRLTDKAYDNLLEKLGKRDFKNVSAEMKNDILKFFADPNSFTELKKDKSHFRKTLQYLDKLKAFTPAS